MGARTTPETSRTTGAVQAAAAAVLVAAALTGCTTVVTGSGRAAEQPAAAPSSTDTAPSPPTGPGTQAEAIRMAAGTPLIEDELPQRADGCVPFGPFTDAAELERLAFLPGTVEPTLRRAGFVAAWSQCRQDGDGQGTLAITMTVADAAAAAAAVADLAGVGGTSPQDAVVLPRSGVTGTLVTAGSVDTVQAWTSVGSTVGYVFHVAAQGWAVAEADQLMVDHRALLDGFDPTPPERVADLPLDPDGLLPLTVRPPGTADRLSGPYELDSLLRQAIDPVAERELLAANGFTGAYSRNSTDGRTGYSITTYMFPSSTQTNIVFEEFARLEADDYGGTPVVAPSVPTAPCFGLNAGTDAAALHYQRCYVGFGRHLARVEVLGAPAPDDLSLMDPLLLAQRDMIDGT